MKVMMILFLIQKHLVVCSLMMVVSIAGCSYETNLRTPTNQNKQHNRKDQLFDQGSSSSDSNYTVTSDNASKQLAVSSEENSIEEIEKKDIEQYQAAQPNLNQQQDNNKQQIKVKEHELRDLDDTTSTYELVALSKETIEDSSLDAKKSIVEDDEISDQHSSSSDDSSNHLQQKQIKDTPSLIPSIYVPELDRIAIYNNQYHIQKMFEARNQSNISTKDLDIDIDTKSEHPIIAKDSQHSAHNDHSVNDSLSQQSPSSSSSISSSVEVLVAQNTNESSDQQNEQEEQNKENENNNPSSQNTNIIFDSINSLVKNTKDKIDDLIKSNDDQNHQDSDLTAKELIEKHPQLNVQLNSDNQEQKSNNNQSLPVQFNLPFSRYEIKIDQDKSNDLHTESSENSDQDSSQESSSNQVYQSNSQQQSTTPEDDKTNISELKTSELSELEDSSIPNKEDQIIFSEKQSSQTTQQPLSLLVPPVNPFLENDHACYSFAQITQFADNNNLDLFQLTQTSVKSSILFYQDDCHLLLVGWDKNGEIHVDFDQNKLQSLKGYLLVLINSSDKSKLELAWWFYRYNKQSDRFRPAKDYSLEFDGLDLHSIEDFIKDSQAITADLSFFDPIQNYVTINLNKYHDYPYFYLHLLLNNNLIDYHAAKDQSLSLPEITLFKSTRFYALMKKPTDYSTLPAETLAQIYFDLTDGKWIEDQQNEKIWMIDQPTQIFNITVDTHTITISFEVSDQSDQLTDQQDIPLYFYSINGSSWMSLGNSGTFIIDKLYADYTYQIDFMVKFAGVESLTASKTVQTLADGEPFLRYPLTIDFEKDPDSSLWSIVWDEIWWVAPEMIKDIQYRLFTSDQLSSFVTTSTQNLPWISMLESNSIGSDLSQYKAIEVRIVYKDGDGKSTLLSLNY